MAQTGPALRLVRGRSYQLRLGHGSFGTVGLDGDSIGTSPFSNFQIFHLDKFWLVGTRTILHTIRWTCVVLIQVEFEFEFEGCTYVCRVLLSWQLQRSTRPTAEDVRVHNVHSSSSRSSNMLKSPGGKGT